MFALFLATVIYSTTSATSDTGGNVSGGGTVVTGSASASSEVQAAVSGGSGTVIVETTSTANGETESTSETYEVAGEPIEITVEAEASSKDTSVSTEVSVEPSVPQPEKKSTIEVTRADMVSVHETEEGAPTSTPEVPAESRGFVETVLQTIAESLSFIGKFFSFF